MKPTRLLFWKRYFIWMFIVCTFNKQLGSTLRENSIRMGEVYHSFHNYTYDLFTFHETSAFIIFLTKSWGLEKNISYGVCFGFLVQYFFSILNSWSYFWNWKGFSIQLSNPGQKTPIQLFYDFFTSVLTSDSMLLPAL